MPSFKSTAVFDLSFFASRVEPFYWTLIGLPKSQVVVMECHIVLVREPVAQCDKVIYSYVDKSIDEILSADEMGGLGEKRRHHT